MKSQRQVKFLVEKGCFDRPAVIILEIAMAVRTKLVAKTNRF
jgi:hypothetical protein